LKNYLKTKNIANYKFFGKSGKGFGVPVADILSAPSTPAYALPAHTSLRSVWREEGFTAPPFGGATSSMRRPCRSRLAP